MRNDTARWPDPRGLPERIEAEGLAIAPLPARPMAMISGPVDAALALYGKLHAWGWPDVIRDGAVALSLRRDRILMLGADEIREGWDGRRGLAISDVSGAWEGLELHGPRAFEVLRMGTEISLDIPSASVARLFSGVELLLWRAGEQRFRLLVPVERAVFIRELLARFVQELPPPPAGFSGPKP